MIFQVPSILARWNASTKTPLKSNKAVAATSGTAESWALPPGPSRRNKFEIWDNCYGTFTYANGDKYVGGHKDDKQHGQGSYTYADGSVKEGVWEYGELLPAQKVTPRKAPTVKTWLTWLTEVRTIQLQRAIELWASYHE